METKQYEALLLLLGLERAKKAVNETLDREIAEAKRNAQDMIPETEGTEVGNEPPKEEEPKYRLSEEARQRVSIGQKRKWERQREAEKILKDRETPPPHNGNGKKPNRRSEAWTPEKREAMSRKMKEKFAATKQVFGAGTNKLVLFLTSILLQTFRMFV